MNLMRKFSLLYVLLLIAAGQARAASEKVLYTFHGNDGWNGSGIIVAPNGDLYGTTAYGGNSNICQYTSWGCGLVFRLRPGANGNWHETVLHKFSNTDGAFPSGRLILDKAGNLYGTTVYGGPNGCAGLGCGVVFELKKEAGGKWTEKVLHTFNTEGDGSLPYGGLIFDAAGNLYGTGSTGGDYDACNPDGCGVVFELTPVAHGEWKETILYTFHNTDGQGPMGTLVFDSAGNLYGTTQFGGTEGDGTVFELTRTHDHWSEQVLHSFDLSKSDGYEPETALVFDKNGNLYGTTLFGGSVGQGWGTAFELSPNGKNWTETILHVFNEHAVGGGYPSGPVLDKQGNLYGATTLGGKYHCVSGGSVGCGVVFELKPRSNGKWNETVLHSFGSGSDGAGALPSSNVFRDAKGHLFGATAQGGYTGSPCGTYGCGVVFEVMP
jgi:uncharacterized repeat protein (TIGR03803 family)